MNNSNQRKNIFVQDIVLQKALVAASLADPRGRMRRHVLALQLLHKGRYGERLILYLFISRTI